MANYVKSKTGSYPFFPTTTRKLLNDPLDYQGDPVILEYTADVGGAPNFDPAQLAAFSAQSLTSQLPQCGDKSSSNIGSSFRNFSLNTYDSDGDYEPAQLAQRHAWLANGYKLKVSNTKLKILPLGDSITYGFQSTDGNGYRGELFAKLSGNGNTIDLVGSVRSGSMPANSNEGHNGATIDQIASYASASLASRPNVVLVHAGTNDMNLPLDPAGAPSRLGNLIDKILVTCPDALVLVSQIVTSGSAATRANILAYNEAIPGVVAARAAKGSKVMVVDMFTRLLAPDNYADDLHPNDGGYKIMGDTWSYAIAYGNALGWISPPAAGSGLITCAKLPTWYPQGQIANGAGLGAKIKPEIPARTWDLNGDGRAEYLWVDAKGAVTAFLNLGPPNGIGSTTGATVNWLPQGVIATGVGAARHEVQFADLNGDGRAEYLRVHPNGSVEAWLNLGGPDNGPNAAKVNWLYNGFVATGAGVPGSSVVFADLNGDGRAEYLSIAANGAVTCWLNLGPIGDNGPNAAKVGWLPQGEIATGVGALRNNTVFAADYLTINRSGSGSVKEWLNGGGPNNGPNAGQPVWYPQGTITTGDGSSGANVVFADLNGDGRAEYIIIDPNTSAVTAYMNACP
ncbi:hypothetical protein IFR05_002168 [Cadophora sp. M221]|nr:hypothetical protein IFR05_002168 [Cadophora sp. M221]